ncbi:MAG TPA: hypothetical protein VK576_06565 [Thermoleophilia bacterium]|nr:hypothetical protein [Thermoleophilia bacterium]
MGFVPPTHSPYGVEKDKAAPTPPSLTEQAAAALPHPRTAALAWAGLAFAALGIVAGYLALGLLAAALAVPGIACSTVAWRAAVVRRRPIGVAVAGCLVSAAILTIVAARAAGIV